jgi:hypothetical protein
MEKPTYNPPRAVELTSFLEGLSPLELRWMQRQCEVVLDRKVEILQRAYHEAQYASYAYHGNIQWMPTGELAVRPLEVEEPAPPSEALEMVI